MITQNYDYVFVPYSGVDALTTVEVTIIEEDLRPSPQMVLIPLLDEDQLL